MFDDDLPQGVTKPHTYTYGTPNVPSAPPAPPAQPGVPNPGNPYGPPSAPPRKKNRGLMVVFIVLAVLMVCGLASCVALVAIGSSVEKGYTESGGLVKDDPTAEPHQAREVLKKLNDAIVAKDTAAYDEVWDRTAVVEYLQPKLIEAMKTSKSWDTIVKQAGDEEAALKLIENVFTVKTLDQQLGRPFLDQGQTIGAFETFETSDNERLLTVKTASGESLVLHLSDDWTVVGFDSNDFMKGFVIGFDKGFAGQQ